MDYSKVLSQNYKGIDVLFGPSDVDQDVMIFATDVLKLFPNKRINDFLNNKQTKELINQISIETGIPASEIIVPIKGGPHNQQGTWMRRELALAFAIWLSPEFYYWCLKKLLELFSNGIAIIDSRLEELVKKNGELNNIILQLQNDNNTLQQQLSYQQPKVTYYDQVLQNQDFKYTLKDICNNLSLKISYKDLANRLVNDGYAYRSKGLIYLKEPYASENYLGSTTILCPDGNYRVQMLWSEGGRSWIHSLACKWRVV